jgi:hypothetical protein
LSSISNLWQRFNLEKGILDYIKKYLDSSSKEIYEELKQHAAFTTIKRNRQI